MKAYLFFYILCLSIVVHLSVSAHDGDTIKLNLPKALANNTKDLVENRLRQQAMMRYTALQLPKNLETWKKQRKVLQDRIKQKTKLKRYDKLPLDLRVTDSVVLDTYVIYNIAFQTRPGIYATGNIYKPKGKGKFPGVLSLCGHSVNGRLAERYQSVGHTLAASGYVSLLLDPWGSGERSTKHMLTEYHGGYLGASLLNVGETFMGMHLADNMKGLDLLSSLPFVDADKLGVTGASGGGNQTMWLTALDERVKAAVPVVSVGTFESCVMRSNCICEVLTDGLTFAETSFILSLAAPRAIKACNHKQDGLTFIPEEMIRSVDNAKEIFKLYGVPNNIDYEIFDLKHGYFPEDRRAMLGWFDLYLKGIGDGKARDEIPFQLQDEQKIVTYKKDQGRPKDVMSTADYCRNIGGNLRNSFLAQSSFDKSIKRNELKTALRLNNDVITKVVNRGKDGDWERVVLETQQKKVIPIIQKAPTRKDKGYVIVVYPEGRDSIPPQEITNLISEGYGIISPDLSSGGELKTKVFVHYYKLHEYARANLWLGKTTMGEWVSEFQLVLDYAFNHFANSPIQLRGYKDTAVAALFSGAFTNTKIGQITLVDAPISYLFDDREFLSFYSMGVHIPDFLEWGDISLAAALVNVDVTFINPRTMSGKLLANSVLEQFKKEYKEVGKAANSQNNIQFKSN